MKQNIITTLKGGTIMYAKEIIKQQFAFDSEPSVDSWVIRSCNANTVTVSVKFWLVNQRVEVYVLVDFVAGTLSDLLFESIPPTSLMVDFSTNVR